MDDKKHFIAGSIKRPGALSARAARNGRSVSEQARADMHKPGLAGEQARYYENVLKPASARRSVNALKVGEK